MNARILNQIPISGSVEEKHFDVVSKCKWFLFEDEKYSQWAGVFGNGFLGGTDVCITKKGAAFVLANGQGYIIDVNQKLQVHKTECDYLKSAICCTNCELFIATDDLRLYIYDCSGHIYTTNRIAIDGIEFSECNSEDVIGRLWGLNEWHEFSFRLKEKELISAWICDFN